MSEIPEAVTVGPYTYRIVADKPFSDSHDCDAYIQYRHQRIVYDVEISLERLRVAVMHELLHAIHDITDRVGEKWEESQVTQDAPHIVELLRRNPALVAFLLAEDEVA
jgi:hypothetical protein